MLARYPTEKKQDDGSIRRAGALPAVNLAPQQYGTLGQSL